MGTAVGFGASAFVVAVLFVGFDPENLAVGASASASEEAGIALGSVVGAAMVAVALAFRLTALLAPMRFGRTARSVLAVPVLAVVLLGALGMDEKRGERLDVDVRGGEVARAGVAPVVQVDRLEVGGGPGAASALVDRRRLEGAVA